MTALTILKSPRSAKNQVLQIVSDDLWEEVRPDIPCLFLMKTSQNPNSGHLNQLPSLTNWILRPENARSAQRSFELMGLNLYVACYRRSRGSFPTGGVVNYTRLCECVRVCVLRFWVVNSKTRLGNHSLAKAVSGNSCGSFNSVESIPS